MGPEWAAGGGGRGEAWKQREQVLVRLDMALQGNNQEQRQHFAYLPPPSVPPVSLCREVGRRPPGTAGRAPLPGLGTQAHSCGLDFLKGDGCLANCSLLVPAPVTCCDSSWPSEFLIHFYKRSTEDF